MAGNATLCLNKTHACLNVHSITDHQNLKQPTSNDFSTSSVYFLLVLCTIAVMENIFTCYIIYANKILQTATNTFVFSLCITDMLCAGVLVPIALFYKNSNVYLYFAAIIVFTYASNLTAVTYERLVSITKPLRYRSIITKQTALRITVAAWLVPISYCLVPLTWKTNVLSIEHKIYMIIALLVFLVSPLFFICFVYMRILIEVHRLLKEGRSLEVYPVQERYLPQSCSSRLRSACCLLANSGSQGQNACSKSDSRMSPNLHEDSNDELSCTIKTDLYYSANSNQSLYGLRQEGRCSLSITSRRSCDSGRQCPHGDALERGQNLVAGEAVTTPAMPKMSTALVCQHRGTGNKDEGQCKASSAQDKNHSTMLAASKCNGSGISSHKGEERAPLVTSGLVTLSEKSDGKLERKTINVEGDHKETHTKKEDDASNQKDEPCIRNRVGFVINPSTDCFDGIATEREIEDDVENGVSEHDSGIEEERCKDAARMPNCERNLDDETVNSSRCPCIEGCIQPHPSPEHISGSVVGTVQNKRNFLARLFKPKGCPENNKMKQRKRHRRSLRRRQVFEEIKASTAFALVAFTYMFTWIPVIYMTFMDAIDKHHLVPNTIDKVNAWTIAINAAVDPLFYALILRNFRKTIKRQFRRMRNGCN